MEKFFNDIVTFVSQMNPALKITLIALFAILDLLVLRAFIKNLSNKSGKPIFRLSTLLLFIIFSGLIVFLSIYSF